MRSRPANASVICVPIDASWMTGIVISAVNDEVLEEVADRHLPGADRGAADQHHRDADGADHQRRERGDRRDAGQRLRDVAEQPVRALREHELLALLGGVGLDDADAAERLGEPAGDLGVDLAALAEQRPQPLERRRHPAAEGAEDDERDDRQLPVQVERTPSAMVAVRIEPVSCTRPVPTRFRMPSASVMIREISTPLLVESK